MPLNYPGSYLEGLMGLNEKFSHLLHPDALFPDFALSTGVAQALKIANPYLEMQERINTWLPKTLNFAGVLGANKYAQSVTEQFQSLSALARPFAQADLAALKNLLGDLAKMQHSLAALTNPLGNWLKVQRSFADDAPFRALQQQSAQLATLGQQLSQNFSGLQQIADWARTPNLAVSPALWSTRLMDWAGGFDAAVAGFEDQLEYDPAQESEEDAAPGMVDTLAPLSAQFETLNVVTPADVAALRAYFEVLYTALLTTVSLAISHLLRNGKAAAASLLVFATSWAGFQSLIGLPATIDFYLQKIDVRLNSEHAAATKEDLKQLKADVIASIKQQAAEQCQLRTVARRLRVRVKPTEKSTCLGNIEAGQQVVVLSLVGKRAYISYQDVDRLPMHGWVLKKYLNAVSRTSY
jgi:hypothetical protein